MTIVQESGQTDGEIGSAISRGHKKQTSSKFLSCPYLLNAYTHTNNLYSGIISRSASLIHHQPQLLMGLGSGYTN